MFVCQFSQSAYDKNRDWGGQIINYDGPPSRYLSNTLEPGVLQIGEPLLAKEFKPTLLTGQVFAGFVGSATVESGRVDAEQVGAICRSSSPINMTMRSAAPRFGSTAEITAKPEPSPRKPLRREKSSAAMPGSRTSSMATSPNF